MNNTVYWVWLTQVFGPGNHRLWDMLATVGNDAQAAFNVLSGGGYAELTKVEKYNLGHTHLEQSEAVMAHCAGHDFTILTYDSEDYPNRLRGIYNPPPILFCMGEFGSLDDDVAISVVGARRPSEYSIRLAKRICEELEKVGVTLVSGFALGIDSMAHQAALKNGGKTIAVLGCGLDVDYPKENSGVKKLIAKRGVVVSEFFPGTQPDPRNFPQRNRILSALSLGTLVVEAGSRSGSLITAELALSQGRDVFCVPPGDLFDERYSGVIKLIRDGAIPTFNHLDILYEYYENFSHKLNSMNPYGYYTDKDASMVFNDNSLQKDVKRREVNSPKAAEQPPRAKIDCEDLSGAEGAIVRLLEERGSLLADEIADALAMEAAEVLALLTELELYGIVNSQAGNRFSV